VSASSTSYLLDVNALIALGVQQHVFHTRVAAWISSSHSITLLLCPVSELGFLRILSQNVAYGFTLETAKHQLSLLKSSKIYSFRFLADDQDSSNLPLWVKTGSQTTDGHLTQLAQAHGALLATLDARIPGAFLIP
jgi:hypothetical protein